MYISFIYNVLSLLDYCTELLSCNTLLWPHEGGRHTCTHSTVLNSQYFILSFICTILKGHVNSLLKMNELEVF